MSKTSLPHQSEVTSMLTKTSLVNPRTMHGEPFVEAPLIKTPFYVDYGVNIHVAPSAFIHRDCYLQDNIYVPISIGEGTMVGPHVHILTVAHRIDWRCRDGVNGPARACSVTIGDDCYIGSHVVIMYVLPAKRGY